MNINEIGGEFALIERLKNLIRSRHAQMETGIGDDAAVIRIAPEPAPLLLVTTDILVENRHFKRNWSTPQQIGLKAVECNVSDIAAMGGSPQWMFVSLVLPPDATTEEIEAIYAGMNRSCKRYDIALAGGDTTQGERLTINITLLGVVTPALLCLRSSARPGDRLMVTGSLGASAAGFMLLSAGETPSAYLKDKHLAPVSRMDVSQHIAPLANAMIDISDGLGSEVYHICEQSRVGAVVNAAAIPLHQDVRSAAARLGTDPVQLALSGGEDFELLFSISPANLPALAQIEADFFEVGHITDPSGPVHLLHTDGRSSPLPRGFNHFQ